MPHVQARVTGHGRDVFGHEGQRTVATLSRNEPGRASNERRRLHDLSTDAMVRIEEVTHGRSMPRFAAPWEADYGHPMISAEMVMAWSLIVRDAAGHSPLKPMDREGAVAIASRCSREEDELGCATLYLSQGFRESGLQLHAPGDCIDHLWDSGTDEYKRTHRRYYQPDSDGKCRPGDGEPTSFGPFQMRTQPKTWAIAVEDFARTLKHAEEVCAHDDGDPTCTPLEVLATGKTRTKEGKRIAAARYAEAERIEREVLFGDDPRQAGPSSPGFSSFTMTTSLSTHEAPHAEHQRLGPAISTRVSPDMSL